VRPSYILPGQKSWSVDDAIVVVVVLVGWMNPLVGRER
jgi:hypothetical protein